MIIKEDENNESVIIKDDENNLNLNINSGEQNEYPTLKDFIKRGYFDD